MYFIKFLSPLQWTKLNLKISSHKNIKSDACHACVCACAAITGLIYMCIPKYALCEYASVCMYICEFAIKRQQGGKSVNQTIFYLFGIKWLVIYKYVWLIFCLKKWKSGC